MKIFPDDFVVKITYNKIGGGFMNYKEYQESRNAVWQILIDEGVNELPIKVSQICKNLGIITKTYDSEEEDDGYSLILEGSPFIFINRNMPKARQRFTCAHELGHIILGHVGKYKLVNREPSPYDSPIEQQANIFASRLLAPACVLHELGISDAKSIAKTCGISIKAAEFRAQRLKKLEERDKLFRRLYNHGCFYLSPLEAEVARQFKDYIEKNKL